MISEMEREQRLRDINRRIREILSERAGIEEKWQGRRPLDISNDLAALDEEIGALRRERQLLQAPELTPEIAKETIDRMWDMVSRLEIQLVQVPKLAVRIAQLETHWADWVARDEAARTRRQSLQNAYGIVFLIVLAVDIITRLTLR